MEDILDLMMGARRAIKKNSGHTRAIRELLQLLCLEDSEQLIITWFKVLPPTMKSSLELDDDTVTRITLGGLVAFSEHVKAVITNEPTLRKLRDMVRSNRPRHTSWVMPK